MEKNLNIAVVGAGIGGLAAAIFLATNGHSLTIFEKFPTAKPLGSGLLLQPPGQDVLDELGLLDAIKSKSATINALHSQNQNGKTILDLHYSDLEGKARAGLGVGRALLHETLMKKADACGAKFVLGTEVSKLNSETGMLATTDKCLGEFDLIIIATGPRDILIDQHIKRTKRQYGWSCLWANVTLPADCPSDQLGQLCKTSKHMIGLLPLNHNENGTTTAAFFWSLRSRRLADWRVQPYEKFIAEVGRIWPSAARAIAPLNHIDFSHAIYYDIGCKKPWSGKIIAIGDAIHGTSPQLGQGATMALLDAKALAQTLQHHQTTEGAFAAFWLMRKKQLTYVRWASRLITPFFQSRSPLAGILRDIACHKITSQGLGNRLALATLASERDHFLL